MPTITKLAWSGFIAAVISVLTFHQGMWEALHLLNLPNLTMPPWYPMDPIAPFGVPRVLNLCFWGGLYGIVFGLAMPRVDAPFWLCGLVLGVIAALVGLLLVPAIKGLPIGAGWMVGNWARSLLINGSWGIGVGLLLPVILGPPPRLA